MDEATDDVITGFDKTEAEVKIGSLFKLRLESLIVEVVVRNGLAVVVNSLSADFNGMSAVEGLEGILASFLGSLASFLGVCGFFKLENACQTGPRTFGTTGVLDGSLVSGDCIKREFLLLFFLFNALLVGIILPKNIGKKRKHLKSSTVRTYFVFLPDFSYFDTAFAIH